MPNKQREDDGDQLESPFDPNILEEVQAASCKSVENAKLRLQLLSSEARLAGVSFALIVALGLLTAVALVAFWALLNTALALFLKSLLSLTTWQVFIAVAFLQLALVGVLTLLIKRLAKGLTFANSLDG